MENLKVGIKLLTSTAKMPEFQNQGDAGADLRADILFPIQLYPGERRVIGTGISLSLPKGYEGQIRSRSGLAAKFGISVLNSPGTIDEGYTGEVKVILINNGTQSKDLFQIHPGDRIAQLVIAKVIPIDYVSVDFINETERGGSGLGSTGTN